MDQKRKLTDAVSRIPPAKTGIRTAKKWGVYSYSNSVVPADLGALEWERTVSKTEAHVVNRASRITL